MRWKYSAKSADRKLLVLGWVARPAWCGHIMTSGKYLKHHGQLHIMSVCVQVMYGTFSLHNFCLFIY